MLAPSSVTTSTDRGAANRSEHVGFLNELAAGALRNPGKWASGVFFWCADVPKR